MKNKISLWKSGLLKSVYESKREKRTLSKDRRAGRGATRYRVERCHRCADFVLFGRFLLFESMGEGGDFFRFPQFPLLLFHKCGKGVQNPLEKEWKSIGAGGNPQESFFVWERVACDSAREGEAAAGLFVCGGRAEKKDLKKLNFGIDNPSAA